MGVQRLTNILDLHFIPYFVREGRVIADSMIGGTGLFENTIDITDYTKEKLYSWLGY